MTGVSVDLHFVAITPLVYFNGLHSHKPLVLFSSIDTVVKSSVFLVVLFGTIDTLVQRSVPLVLLFVELSIQWPRAVCCQSYFLLNYQYTSPEQCVISLSICRTIDTVFKSSVLFIVLL